ncbi:MAG: ComF family protein [Clostridia bacterium]|nr:ComF family protein [Clostridia bacterium]
MNNTLRDVLSKLFFQVNYTCNACEKEIFTGKYFCDDCEKTLPKIKKDRCDHCGRITNYAVNYCNSCVEWNINFDKARSAFDYVEPINAFIKAFKYDGKKYLAEVFADKLKSIYVSEFLTSDVIVSVPMTAERLKERGYNHAELLASELSNLINVPYDASVIKKTRETPRQANLTKLERRNNLKKSFTVYKSSVENKHVLLVDDVLTTGATADILASALKKKGALTVTVLTVASVQSSALKVKFEDETENIKES